MSKSVCQTALPFHSQREILARFDGGNLTSDSGWLMVGRSRSASSSVRGLQFLYFGRSRSALRSA